jgi:uncharacterized repeat protein (TIGR01451 family)
MNYLAKIKSLVTVRHNAVVGIAVIAVVAAGLLLVPQKANIKTLAENCQNPPVTPTLNYWPVTYADDNIPLCSDYPAIDAAVDVANPVFSQSESDWNDGLTLNPGQNGVALMYIHNGAANNLDPNTTMARNVRIVTETDTTTGSAHNIRVTFAGDNTNTVRSSFTIHTPADSHLELYPNSGQMYTYEGRPILDQQNLNLGNSTFTLGDLDACFEWSVFLSFKFKVVQNAVQTPTLSINKQVRNVTKNTSFADSVASVQNDQVQYQIKVKNNGPTVATSVTLTDNGVAGISINPGILNAAGSPISGNFPGSVNIGDLQPGEERAFTYTGRVNVTTGSLTNTATAKATNTPAVSDTATVTVTPVQPTNAVLSISKMVRSVNSTTFADSITVPQNQFVEYRVEVTNNGPAVATGVTLADSGTSGTQFSVGSITKDGQVVSGSIPGTISLGDLAVGQKVTVKYAAKVIAATGSFTNTATAQATNAPAVSDTANVNVQVITQPGRLAITKLVKNDTLNSNFVDSTEARTGDRVTFQIAVTNNGSSTVNNVHLHDTLPVGLNLESGTIRVDGVSTSNITDIFLGNLAVNQTKTITFTAQVVAVGPVTLRNVALARGDSVSDVTDDAFVVVINIPKPGTPNIVLSKRAFNDTKNVDATTVNASREDFITYSLITANQGTADAVNYIISDDLSQVLPFADMVELNGGTLNGNTITYPAVTIRPGETVVKTFKVRVKASLQSNLSFQMRNTYGNTIVINIPGTTVFEAPKTGAAGTSAAVFAGLITSGFIAFKKRSALLKLILA